MKNEFLECVKSAKNSHLYTLMSEDIDNIDDFLSKKDLEKNFSELEELIYSFQLLAKIYFLSVLLDLKPKSKYYHELVKVILNEKMSINTRNFLLWQWGYIGFNNHKLRENTDKMVWDIYFQIYNNYRAKFENKLNLIPKNQRNKKNIIILTSYVSITLSNAPTKMLLDWAYYLKKLGYEVGIINTMEMLSQNGKIPFYNSVVANTDKILSNKGELDYLDETFTYMQCSEKMPNFEEMDMVIGIINQVKPYMIFSIASVYDLTANLCNHMVPVINIPASNKLSRTFSTFNVLARAVTEQDIEMYSCYGYGKDNLIFHSFGFESVKQTKTFKRKDFNLSEDKFVLAIVGNRLDREIKTDFIYMLLETLSLNTYLLFIGEFEKYEEMCEKIPLLRENSMSLGHQPELKAIYELCDLYVNPKRAGAGTSAMMALEQSLPILTHKFGDVYLWVGDDFAVNDDTEYLDMMKLYITNKDYYKKQKDLAKKISEGFTDMKTSIKELIEKIETHELFV